jgi:transposase-like protein
MPRRKKQSSEAAVRDIRRKTRRRFSAEEKIRIVLDGLRGESICFGYALGSQFSMSPEALLAHGDHCESPIAQN